MKLVKNLPTILSLGNGVCILMLVTGCIGVGGGDVEPTLYYTLESVEAVAATGSTEVGGINVGLEKVKVPDYLDRKEIVVRTRHNELRYTGNHLWAERPSGSLPRLLAQNISHQIAKPAHVFVLPWPDTIEPDLTVLLEVRAFEGKQNPDAEVLFDLSWSIRSAPDGTVLKQGTHRSHGLSWEAGDYSDLAAVLSAELTTVGRLVGLDISEIRDTFVK